MLEIILNDSAQQGTVARLEINFNGKIWENSEGMFRGSYLDNGSEKK